MGCPDINEFLDGMDERELPTELQAHLETCPACRQRIRIVELIQRAMAPDIQVPDRVSERAMAGIRAAQMEEESWSRGRDFFGTLGFSWLTTVAILLFTGAGETGNPRTVMLFALGIGLGCTLFRWWRGWPKSDSVTV